MSLSHALSLSLLIPNLGSKRLPIRHRPRERSGIRIQIIKRIRHVRVAICARVHEPLRRIDLLRQNQRKEDDERGNVQARVQTRRRDVVVLGPPPAELAFQKAVEKNPHGGPAQVNVHGGRRDLPGAAKDERPVQVADVAAREPAGREPGEHRQRGAEEPVPLQRGVDAAGAKDATGPNDTPYDGGGVEDAGTGAGVAVGLVGVADAGDGAEGPVEDGDLDDAGPEAGADLRSERDARLLGGGGQQTEKEKELALWLAFANGEEAGAGAGGAGGELTGTLR